MTRLSDLLTLADALADGRGLGARLEQGIRRRRLDWPRLAELANRHLVSAALWPALRRRGFIALLPADCRHYLAELYRMNAWRNERLRAQTEQALAALATRGIRPVLLKGSAWLFDPSLDSGARMMADIDLLVVREGFDEARTALEGLGYRLNDPAASEQHALTMGRDEDLATIDLHRDLGPQHVLLPAEEALRNAETLPVPGLSGARLSPTHRALHCLINSEVVGANHHLGELALRPLLDLSVFSRADVDWPLVQHRLKSNGMPHAAPAALLALEQLLGICRPAGVSITLRAHLHYRRCLLQVPLPPLRAAAQIWTALVHPFDPVRLGYKYGQRRSGRQGHRLHHALLLARRDGRALLRRIGAIGATR
jgi:hypothetical protein